jgi:hypothetical protein
LVGPGTDWIEARQRHLGNAGRRSRPLFLLAERFPGDPERSPPAGRSAWMATRLGKLGPAFSAAFPRDAPLALVDRHLAAPRQDDPPAAATGSPLHVEQDFTAFPADAARRQPCRLRDGVARPGAEQPDRPWQPTTTASGELVPGKPSATANTAGAADYRPPANPALASITPPGRSIRRIYTLPELIDMA